MPARKSKSWLGVRAAVEGANPVAPAAASTVGTPEHKIALEQLRADTKRLAELSARATELGEHAEQTQQAIEVVSDKLLEQPDNAELNAEWDKLSSHRKRLEDQLANVTRKRLSASATVQLELKTDLHALNNLLTSWYAHIAERAASELMAHIDPAKAEEALPLCQKLALCSKLYTSTLARCALPVESYAWTAPLRPMPSQKLDTGLVNDPLFKPPDINAIVKAILCTAEELIPRWAALLTEIESSAGGFAVAPFREATKPTDEHPEYAEPLEDKSEAAYIAAAARDAGRRVEDLSERELAILQREYRDSQSYREKIPFSDHIQWAQPLPEPQAVGRPDTFVRQDMSQRIPEPAS